MTERLREQLSAMMDGELPETEQALLMARLQRDPELRRSWARYHMIGDSLRGQHLVPEDIGIADAVTGALQTEPAHRVGHAALLRKAAKPIAGLAVAASVAVVAVLSLQQVGPDASGSGAIPMAQAPAVPATLVRAPQDNSAATAAQLNQYLVNHNEFAAGTGVRGMLPYVRIVGFDSDSR